MQKWLLILFLILLLAALVSCLAQPAGAQVPTVTPLPGPVATATASAQQLANAQAQRQQADALAQQAQQLRQSSDALTASAQQAASDSRAALLAQQFGVASEAIGRAESDIASLKDNAAQSQGIIAAQSEIINSQYISLTQISAERDQARSEVVQLKAINAALNQNNQTILAQQQADAKSADVLSLAPLFIAFLFLIGLLGFGAWLWQRRNGVTVTTSRANVPHDDVIDTEYTQEKSE